MKRTRWWYLIASMGLNALWSLVGVLSEETITFGPATLWIVLGGSFLVPTPLFCLALYRETAAAGPGRRTPARGSVSGVSSR